ncbi:hypothetical protein RQP46_001743 [Phenoliferia psychrophenolica]
MSAVKTQLVVFDFDWSFADQDTDRYVFEVLAPALRKSLRAAKTTTQWTDNVANHLVELHKLGTTREELEGALKGLPVHPAMMRGVQAVKARQEPTKSTFFCLSNSNSVFINTMLNHHGLSEQFVEIVTNPAEFKASGLLHLERRVSPAGEQHGCKVGCSANMCKGKELDEFMTRHGGWAAFDRVVYVGDGGNDFCPLLRLRAQDVALVRMYRELSRRIAKEGVEAGLKCSVVPWGGAWEVEAWLMDN